MRKIERNILKSQIGSNKIRRAWRRKQINKYGIEGWLRRYRACVGRLTKREAYLL